MAGDSDQIVVAADGDVYVAPEGAAAPNDSSGALDPAWELFGFVSDAGVQVEVGTDYSPLVPWNNGGYRARTIVNGRSLKLSFTAEEISGLTLPTAFGGGAVTAGDQGVNEVVDVALTGFSGTDSFKLTFGGNESAIITRGTNYTAAGIKAAFEGISGVSGQVKVTGVSDSGFRMEFQGDLADTDVGAVTVTSGVGVTGIVTVATSGNAAGAGEFIYTPPAFDDAVAVNAWVVDWSDGDKDYRLYVPRAEVTNTPTMTLTRSDAVMLPLEIEAVPSDPTSVYTLFTNDPSFG